jgi:hypothetical protein
LLVNPTNQALAEADTREAQATADVLGVNLLVLKAMRLLQPSFVNRPAHF